MHRQVTVHGAREFAADSEAQPRSAARTSLRRLDLYKRFEHLIAPASCSFKIPTICSVVNLDFRTLGVYQWFCSDRKRKDSPSSCLTILV